MKVINCLTYQYKGWCKSKKIQNSKPKYICDRMRTFDRYRNMIFYTRPQIIFFATPAQEEMWFDIIQRIHAQGFKTFDMD